MAFTASDVLLKAASRIEEDGKWCQGDLFDGERACALGAIYETHREMYGTYSGSQSPINLLARHLHPWRFLWAPKKRRLISKWNDSPGRTAYEVAEAMRRAGV